MSYTVIARRYRPQTFEEVVGQSAIATTLQNSIKDNKVSHAYIFAGDRGVGKTSMARILAKALNCKSGPTIRPCNKCEFCKSINEGNDADVIEIDAASQTKVDDVRVLQEGVGYVPLRSKYKIYIMDEAHQLSRSAFNALLKTIEEPPPHVKFIFATTEPHKLPDTIISRCQRFNFRRISPQDIYEHLQAICKKEKVLSDNDTLAMVAQMANGSMRDAESVLDQLISFSEGKISKKDIESLMGVVAIDKIFDLLGAVSNKSPSEIIDIIEDVFSQGKDITVFINQIIEHAWRLVLTKVSPEDSPVMMKEIVQDKKRYYLQAKQFDVKNLLEYIKQLSDVKMRLKETSNVRVLIEFTFLQMANLESSNKDLGSPQVNLEKQAKKILEGKVDIEGDPVLSESKSDSHPISPADVGDYWPKIMDGIRKVNFKVHAYLKDAHFVSADNQEIVIGFPPQCNFHLRMFDDINNKKVLESYVHKVTGLNLPVTMTILKDKSIKKNNNEQPDDPGGFADNSSGQDGNLIKDLLNNPIIQKVQEEFDARIIKTEDSN